MIAVSRLDGTPLVVNAELIETIEATPDTHLSLIDGKMLIVRESPDEVVERVIAYRNRAYGGRRTTGPSTGSGRTGKGLFVVSGEESDG